jgi:hypothetical protein
MKILGYKQNRKVAEYFSTNSGYQYAVGLTQPIIATITTLNELRIKAAY